MRYRKKVPTTNARPDASLPILGGAFQTGKTGRPTRLEQLSPETYSKLIVFIRSGAFQEQAAKAIGVTPGTFRQWLSRGEEDVETETDTVFAKLYLDVMQARGEARVFAETQVRSENPLAWLRYAGRSRENEPGWDDQEQVVSHVLSGDEEHPVTVTHKSDAMRQALELLQSLGMNPHAVLEQRPENIFSDVPKLAAPEGASTEVTPVSAADPPQLSEGG